MDDDEHPSGRRSRHQRDDRAGHDARVGHDDPVDGIQLEGGRTAEVEGRRTAAEDDDAFRSRSPG